MPQIRTRQPQAVSMPADVEPTKPEGPQTTAAGHQEQAEIHCGAATDTGNACAGKPTAGRERNDSR